MNKHSLTVISVFLLPTVLILQGLCNEARAQETFKVEGHIVKVSEFDSQVERILNDASLPGLSLAVIDQDQVVFFKTYGYKRLKKLKNGNFVGKQKVNKRTVFEACSLSKSYFVFAAHKLVDQGILKLDTPLYKYLEYPRLAYDDRYKKITARMVLTHSSGLENWQSYNKPDTLEIVSAPGEQFVYSGEGYVYLSKVVEKLLSKSTEQYMKELVYEPLGLDRTFTTFSKNVSRPTNHSLGHDSFKQSYPKEKNKNPNIAGNISTTSGDYAKLLIGIFGGGHLSKARVAELIGGGVKLDENLFYGPGFSLFYEGCDTLVFQHGNNENFKGFGGYNVTRKSGFVMFVNGQLGDLIRSAMNELVFNMKENVSDITQYPNLVFEVLKVYNEKGYHTALNKLEETLTVKASAVSHYELEELQHLFQKKEPAFSEYIGEVLKTRFADQSGRNQE
ncbi:MAG: beta-lactamase family protein [Cytophagales bacterium]|nr:beta-lactamase family protein [Cytophagales bacterium]MCA6366777.1 beta-lactamase family protein [Cytophagales bacterium]MCA6370835.1 beta-lactamase family protein [Cytophagales bacterium]MCA6375745.1 beta-lactamase family protein [Cytophagales bacterium]MCA6384695.1 beta-lactamase family protein [Cytophagales bacterium]